LIGGIATTAFTADWPDSVHGETNAAAESTEAAAKARWLRKRFI
jgi:hypothetical protein